MDLVLASRISILLVNWGYDALMFTFQRYNSSLGLLFGPLGHFCFYRKSEPRLLQGCFVLISLFVCLLQGARALSTFVGHFTDPELSRLASRLPFRCLGAKADSTTERYSRAFERFRFWASSYKEISVLPSNYLSVATYLES